MPTTTSRTDGRRWARASLTARFRRSRRARRAPRARVPLLDLYLGQQDDGSLPKSTTARQSFDACPQGFGPGANGPFLISVDLSKKPAKADQDQIDQINQQENSKQKAAGQADQQEQQLEAQGLPPDQAQAQVQPQLDKQLDQISQQADDQKQQAENPATDPHLPTLRDDLKKTDGVHSVTQPHVNNKGTAAVMSLQPTTAPADRSDRRPGRDAARRRHPEGRQGRRHEDVRRRHDGGLRRPRRRDLLRARPDDRGGHRAELPAADARVPLDRHPGDRRDHDLLLDRGRLRRRDRGVREGLGRAPGGARRAGRDRQLRAADDVRRAVRALDGLRGVPHEPRARGVAAHEGQPAPPSSRASARRAG